VATRLRIRRFGWKLESIYEQQESTRRRFEWQG
jgi:hypothetical protein